MARKAKEATNAKAGEAPAKRNANGETSKNYHRMEVARIPKAARVSAKSRLFKLGHLLEGALDDEEMQRAMSMIAGIVNRVSAGVRLEVAASVGKRAEAVRRRAEHDCDLHAAGELSDLADDLRTEAWSLCDWRPEDDAPDVAQEYVLQERIA